MGLSDASDSRLGALTQWVVDTLGFADSRIEPASADASFRRYFRVTRGSETHIVMDAPPDKEDLVPFVTVARLLAGMGLNVPIVLARDETQGFLLLSDLGSTQYLDELKADREVERLYGDALSALVTLQTAADGAARALPAYDRALLLREMELMPQWFLSKHLGLKVSGAERAMLDRLFDTLAGAALAQPRCFVHRDYHSRNLLLCGGGAAEVAKAGDMTADGETTNAGEVQAKVGVAGGAKVGLAGETKVALAEAGSGTNPGILDFQDAVYGPVTYDAVSLLKDCYIAWPTARVREWLLEYRRKLQQAGVAVGADAAEFIRWFDLMGLQRHIKVLGIFARLFYRDGKPGYLKDLPRVLDYVRAAALAYPETAEFAGYVTTRIDPAFARARTGVRSAAGGGQGANE